MMGFYLRLSTFVLFIHFTIGHIIVYRKNQTIEEFYDLPAQFGPPLPPNGLRVSVIEAVPKDACSKVNPPPKDPSTKFVLVIARTNCTFEEKVRNAQYAKYDAAIVYNIGSDDLEQMSAKNGADIKIPSVFVGETTGSYITEEYYYISGFELVINDELPFNINTHLILPFSILVGLCFIIMIVYMIYKCAREQRRLRQHRLPKRLLKKIPTIKFTKGLPYETCVICLEEYAEGEKLRVLPCQHAYHCTCIDTWLTKNRRVCPICKRKVFPKGESSRRSRRRPVSSDSMSDSETDDTTPLLNPFENNANANHGTFNSPPAAPPSANANDENNSSSAQQAQERSNPFNRVLLDNNSEPSIQSVSNRIFNPFSILRWFRRNRSSQNGNIDHHAIENPINAVLENTERSIAVNLPPRPSSNNILNTNLSGSFHSSNDHNDRSDDDDEHMEGRTIYEPINSAAPIITTSTVNETTSPVEGGKTANNNGNNELESTSDSVFIQTPSRGGISVAALPNTSFQQNSGNIRESGRSRRGNNSRGAGSTGDNSRKDGSLFIV